MSTVSEWRTYGILRPTSLENEFGNDNLLMNMFDLLKDEYNQAHKQKDPTQSGVNRKIQPYAYR